MAILYDESGTAQLLVTSRVIPSLQHSFAVVPFVMLTSDRREMGEFANSPWLKAGARLVAVVIARLNVRPLDQTVREWVS